jgi:hypothetical protein
MTEEVKEQNPTSTEIIAALERTGFLLEQRAAQKFQAAGFAVSVNSAFPDSDTGKSREIDILAGLYDSPDDAEVGSSASVIMECKNYAVPLIVIGKRRTRWAGTSQSPHLSFDPFTLGFPDQEFRSASSELFRDRPIDRTRNKEFIGSQLVRLDRHKGGWSADNSSIYDSILYPLVKAYRYQIDVVDSNERAKQDHNVESWEFPMLSYYLPGLLTAGDVYAVEVDRDDEPSVSQVKWAPLERVFNSRDLRATLRADIVGFAHLDEYIEHVATMVHEARDILTANKNLFDPEWLLSNLGEPAHLDDFNAWLNYFRHGKSGSPPW